ncbi:hypothetical protein [Crocosphaera chwakensis]|nr:hypothetical protein [Crocosphaera chwakensis]
MLFLFDLNRGHKRRLEQYPPALEVSDETIKNYAHEQEYTRG